MEVGGGFHEVKQNTYRTIIEMYASNLWKNIQHPYYRARSVYLCGCVDLLVISSLIIFKCRKRYIVRLIIYFTFVIGNTNFYGHEAYDFHPNIITPLIIDTHFRPASFHAICTACRLMLSVCDTLCLDLLRSRILLVYIECSRKVLWPFEGGFPTESTPVSVKNVAWSRSLRLSRGRRWPSVHREILVGLVLLSVA